MNTKLLEKVQNPLCDELGLIGGMLGAGISAIGQAVSNEQTFKHNKELMGLQFNYGEQAADNAQQRLMEINQNNWEKYNSYEAQRASMENAGLSPALLYGSRGQGGTGMASSAPQGGGAGLPNNPVGNVGLAAVQGAQLGLLQAQIKKTEAEANNINSKTPLETRAIELSNKAQEIQNQIQDESKEFTMMELEFKAQNLYQEYQKLTIEIDFLNEAKNAGLNPIIASIRNTLADTALKGAEKILAEHKTKLTDEQKRKVTEEIELLIKQKKYQELQNDWYIAQIFINAGVELAGDLVGLLGKGVAAFFKKPTQITNTTNNDNRGANQTKNTTVNNNGPQY